MPKTINFVCTKDTELVSGGYIYNQHLLAGLQHKGYAVVHYDPDSIAMMQICDFILVDSIAVKQCATFLVNLDTPIVLLCHLPPEMQSSDANTQNIDTDGVAVAQLLKQSLIVNTGSSCARYMHHHHNIALSSMRMVMPGLLSNWQAKSEFASRPKQLLVVASLLPNKGYDILLPALQGLMDHDWSLHIYGETRFAPEFAADLLAQIESGVLKSRITYKGVVTQTEINRAMIESDLMIQLSSYEPYSMVSLEAINSNLPMLSAMSGEQGEFEKSGLIHYLTNNTVEYVHQTLSLLLTEESSYAKLCNKPSLKARDWQVVVNEFDVILRGL